MMSEPQQQHRQAAALRAQRVISACFYRQAPPIETTFQGRGAVLELMNIRTVSMTVVKICITFRESNRD